MEHAVVWTTYIIFLTCSQLINLTCYVHLLIRRQVVFKESPPSEYNTICNNSGRPPNLLLVPGHWSDSSPLNRLFWGGIQWWRHVAFPSTVRVCYVLCVYRPPFCLWRCWERCRRGCRNFHTTCFSFRHHTMAVSSAGKLLQKLFCDAAAGKLL